MAGLTKRFYIVGLILTSEAMICTVESVQIPAAAWALNSGLVLGHRSQNTNSNYTYVDA